MSWFKLLALSLWLGLACHFLPIWWPWLLPAYEWKTIGGPHVSIVYEGRFWLPACVSGPPTHTVWESKRCYLWSRGYSQPIKIVFISRGIICQIVFPILSNVESSSSVPPLYYILMLCNTCLCCDCQHLIISFVVKDWFQDIYVFSLNLAPYHDVKFSTFNVSRRSLVAMSTKEDTFSTCVPRFQSVLQVPPPV